MCDLMKGPARSGPMTRAASSAQPAASVVRGRRISIMALAENTPAIDWEQRGFHPFVASAPYTLTRGDRDARRDTHGHGCQRLAAPPCSEHTVGRLVLLRQGGPRRAPPFTVASGRLCLAAVVLHVVVWLAGHQAGGVLF